MGNGCDEPEVEKTVTVHVRSSGSDDNPGTRLKPISTFLGGLRRIRQLAFLPPHERRTRFILDLGPGTFDLPPQTPESEADTLISRNHFVLRGAGSDETVLQAPGGDGTWALRFQDAYDLRLEGFRLTFAPSALGRSSGIDLQRVSNARIVDVHIDPIPYYGLRSYGGDDPEAPRARCLRIERCRFANQPHVGNGEHPEALLIADRDDVQIRDCVFQNIEENALGFWRAVSCVSVADSTFDQCRTGLYFGRSVHDLHIEGCDFRTDGAVQGALLADSEDDDPSSAAPTPGPATAIVVQDCTFRSRCGGGNAIELGSVHHVIVKDCRFERFSAIPIVLGASDRPPAEHVLLWDNTVTWFDGQLDDVWWARPVIRIQNVGLSPQPIRLWVNGLCTSFEAAPAINDAYRTIVSVAAPAWPEVQDLDSAALALWEALEVTVTGVQVCGQDTWQVFLRSVVFEGCPPQSFDLQEVDPSCTCGG